MGISEQNLPFARGTTWGDGEVTLSDTTGKSLEGRVYFVNDTLHGTGRQVGLRVVKNDAGARLSGVDRQCLSFSVASDSDWGNRVDGVAGTGGEMCKPVDDYYQHVGITGFADDDLFYVVDSGPCNVLSTTGGATGVTGGAAQMYGNGKIGAAAAADTAIGTIIDASGLSTATSVATLLEIRAGVYTDSP